LRHTRISPSESAEENGYHFLLTCRYTAQACSSRLGFAPAAWEKRRTVKTGSNEPAGETRARKTQQRNALLDVLAGSGRFRTAQEIYTELRGRGERIGLTTVYRHLQRLADDGTVHAVQTEDRQMAYRQCGTTPHHHLICTECRDCVEISDAELDQRVEGEAEALGFADITHNVEIFGVCPECRGTNLRVG
jgi:Fur family ferric uptake transcriptional regulator